MQVTKTSPTIFGQFIRYASLNVLGMFGISLYILADTFFIANGVGADGLTALNLAVPAYNFLHGCALMLGLGGATRYTVSKSQGKTAHANKFFTHTILLATLFSTFFFCVGLVFAAPLARILGANAEVFDMTYTYLRIILLFAPAFIFNEVFLAFVRNDGAPHLAMYAMVGGSLANILFDYIFIFPLHMESSERYLQPDVLHSSVCSSSPFTVSAGKTNFILSVPDCPLHLQVRHLHLVFLPS